MAEQVVEIPLDQIVPHPANRKVGGFDQAKLESLAESVRAIGVQQPIVVRKKVAAPDVYELIAGERRWRASKLAWKETIPAVVRDLDDETALKIRIVENLQREDVHPLDEADGYAALLEGGKYDVAAIAGELGKSPSYIYQRLKLRDLVPAAREKLVSGEITAGHAILIARLGSEQQEQVLKEAFRSWAGNGETISVRQLDSFIQREIFLALSRATWKMNDETLVPAAGSCSSCAKRTGANIELFADVCKHDHCIDRACFNGKAEAMVERRRVELEKKNETYLEVYDAYGRNDRKGVLQPYEWTECKKTDDGAQRVLVVGGEKPGRLTYGTKRKYCYDREQTPEEIEKEKEKKRREKNLVKAAEMVRATIYEKVRKYFLENQSPEALVNSYCVIEHARLVELMRLEIDGIYHRLDWNTQKKVAKHLGWEIPQGYSGALDPVAESKIASMNRNELQLFVLDMTFVPHLKIESSWGGGIEIPDVFRKAAAIVGADLDAAIAMASKAFDVPAEELAMTREERQARDRARWEQEDEENEEDEDDESEEDGVQRCRVCGCTDDDCHQCIEKTGEPCYWVEEDLCSACAAEVREGIPEDEEESDESDD